MSVRSMIIGFVTALAGALVFSLLRLPLPWMLGPVVATAATQLVTGSQSCPATGLRNAAQVGLGVAIGLAFQPMVAEMAFRSWPAMLAIGLGAVAIGMVGTWFFHRAVGLDLKTAYFSAAIGGAWEMYQLAERYGAKADLVAAAHVLRISLVVLVVPNLFALAGVRGNFELQAGHDFAFSYGGLALLLGTCAVAGYAASRGGLPNAWVLAPLLLTAVLTGAGVELSSMPKPLVWAAQLFMGWSMGAKFSREFFAARPWFLATVALYTVLAMALASSLAFAVAALSGQHLASVMLGAAPGGVAEMSLTATALRLDVPLVTSLHLVRVLATTLLIATIFKLVVEPLLRKYHRA